MKKNPWFASEANTKDLERENGLWLNLREGKIVVPHAEDLRTQLITELHDCPYSGHCGITKTVKLTRKSCWWPSLHEDVLEHVRHCATCQKNKPRTQLQAGLLQPVELPEDHWQGVTVRRDDGLHYTAPSDESWPRCYHGDGRRIDQDGALCSYHNHLHSACDCEALAQCAQVVRTHGVPAKIIIDRGPQFAGQFSEAVWKAIAQWD